MCTERVALWGSSIMWGVFNQIAHLRWVPSSLQKLKCSRVQQKLSGWKPTLVFTYQPGSLLWLHFWDPQKTLFYASSFKETKKKFAALSVVSIREFFGRSGINLTVSLLLYEYFSVFLSLLGQLLFSLPEFQLIVVWITNASSVLVLLPFLPSLLFALSLQFPKEN